MEPVNILKKIIETGGKCDFARPKVCLNCPLSKLKPTDRGGFMGCLEALGAYNISVEEADLKYLIAAQKKLIDLEMELILETPTDDIE